MSSGALTEKQFQALLDSHQNVQNKIDALLSVQNVREQYEDGYGREVDRALEKPDLSPEEADALMKQTMKLLRREDIDLLSPKIFSPQLVRVNEQQAEEFLAAQQAAQEQQEARPVPSDVLQLKIMQSPKPSDFPDEVNQDTQIIDDLLAEIQNYKIALGGSPHFPGGLPQYQDSRETILGYPREAFEAFCREHIRKAGNFFTRGFYKTLAKVGGIHAAGLDQTPYEAICLHLQSLKAIARKKTAITEMFSEANAFADNRSVTTACGLFFADVSRIACHAADNSPAGLLSSIDSYFGMLRQQFPHEREAGTLVAFFSELRGVCFEDRTRRLQEYCLANPTGETEMREVPQDGNWYVRELHLLPDVDSSMDYATAASKWVGAIKESNHVADGELLMEKVLPCLLFEMKDKTFVDIDNDGNPVTEMVDGKKVGVQVTLTEKMLRDEKLRSVLVDVWMVVDE